MKGGWMCVYCDSLCFFFFYSHKWTDVNGAGVGVELYDVIQYAAKLRHSHQPHYTIGLEVTSEIP